MLTDEKFADRLERFRSLVRMFFKTELLAVV